MRTSQAIFAKPGSSNAPKSSTAMVTNSGTKSQILPIAATVSAWPGFTSKRLKPVSGAVSPSRVSTASW